MGKQSIPTGMSPEVFIDQVAGNLEVRGWDEPQVVVKASPDTLKLEEKDEVIRLSCDGSCEVRLPHGASLQVNAVHGNAQFRFLEDDLSIGEVHGSLQLREVATTQVGTVHGHLSARAISGDLQAAKVDGHTQVRDIQGKCSLDTVGGHVELRDIEGDIQASADGNARLRLGMLFGTSYHIQADGNVHCRIPEDAGLQLSLTSGTEVIRLSLPGESRTLRQSHYETTLGDGQASMQIEADGLIYLESSGSWEEAEAAAEAGEGYVRLPDDLSQQITRQVEAQMQSQMEAMTSQLNQQMAQLTEQMSKSGLSPEEVERIMAQARQTSEREAERAQEKMRRAQEKLERKLEAAQRHREMHADRRTRGAGRGSFSFDWPPPPPSPPTPPKEAVSEEERLMILRMLEQKKISLEEAEKLLAALEGSE